MAYHIVNVKEGHIRLEMMNVKVDFSSVLNYNKEPRIGVSDDLKSDENAEYLRYLLVYHFPKVEFTESGVYYPVVELPKEDFETLKVNCSSAAAMVKEILEKYGFTAVYVYLYHPKRSVGHVVVATKISEKWYFIGYSETNGGSFSIFSKSAFLEYYKDWEGLADPGQLLNIDPREFRKFLQKINQLGSLEESGVTSFEVKKLFRAPGYFTFPLPIATKKGILKQWFVLGVLTEEGQVTLFLAPKQYIPIKDKAFMDILEENYSVAKKLKTEGLKFLEGK